MEQVLQSLDGICHAALRLTQLLQRRAVHLSARIQQVLLSSSPKFTFLCTGTLNRSLCFAQWLWGSDG